MMNVVLSSRRDKSATQYKEENDLFNHGKIAKFFSSVYMTVYNSTNQFFYNLEEMKMLRLRKSSTLFFCFININVFFLIGDAAPSSE